MLALVATLVMAVAPDAGAAQSAADVSGDIAERRLGRDEIAELRGAIGEDVLAASEKSTAAGRWMERYGISSDIRALDYFTFDGVEFVVPKAMRIEAIVVRTSPDGAVGSSVQITTPGVPVTTATGFGIGSAPYWQVVSSSCFARQENNTGWFDTCFKMSQLKQDGDSSKDYYDLEHYGTGKSKSTWSLTSLNIRARKASGSTSMQWYDWKPRSDTSQGGCGTVSISLSVGSASVGGSYSQCETWDITKYSEAGRFRNVWKKPWWKFVVGSEREVAYNILVKVNNGGWPIWNLWSDFGAV